MSDFTPIYYKGLGGLSLYARDYPNTDAGLTVLCLHGLTRNSADFHGLAVKLQKSYRVISVDVRGRGRSDYDDNAENYQLPVYCTDTFMLLAEHVRGPVAVIGTSMGGLMAMMMSMMKPDCFAAVALNDIGPELETAGLDKIKGYIGTDVRFPSYQAAGMAVSMIGAANFPDFTADDWEAFARNCCEKSPEGSIRFAYDPHIADPIKASDDAAVPPDLWPMYESLIGTPTLILRGALSDLFADKTAKEMAARHSGATYVEVPNRGHAPTLDEPVSVEAITALLAKVP